MNISILFLTLFLSFSAFANQSKNYFVYRAGQKIVSIDNTKNTWSIECNGKTLSSNKNQESFDQECNGIIIQFDHFDQSYVNPVDYSWVDSHSYEITIETVNQEVLIFLENIRGGNGWDLKTMRRYYTENNERVEKTIKDNNVYLEVK
ncbi:MAG: hypothetical protein KDD52_09030 [Bdellovibrionales bacterium]|nr:hypothetical protein [Bdellovibrionales bacterium]